VSEAFELRRRQFADRTEKSVVAGWCRQIAHVGLQTVCILRPDRTHKHGLAAWQAERWVSMTCLAPLSSLIAQFRSISSDDQHRRVGKAVTSDGVGKGHNGRC
jgi:hypothetical protein